MSQFIYVSTEQSRDFYAMYRNQLGFQKCPAFLKWMKLQFPNRDLHHLLGTFTGRKMTDYLVIPIEHKFHLEKVTPDPGAYFMGFLPDSVRYLCKWAMLVNIEEADRVNKIMQEKSISPEAIKEIIKYAELRNN